MRIHKYRAWDKKNKRMIDSVDVFVIDGKCFGVPDKTYNTPYLELERKRNWLLIQYTGLKSKSGVEIYEGDIVEDDDSKYEVLWLEDKARFSLGLLHPIDVGIIGLDIDEIYEIIGNIYENKDLLK